MSGKYIKNILLRPAAAKILVKFALGLHNLSYKYAGILSTRLESDKIHPKHRIMKYHDWFVKHIDRSWTVLDIGCGNGALTFDISKSAKETVGIDFEERNIKIAEEMYKKANLKFICTEAAAFSPGRSFDCIVLSNVLEHIENRKAFLERLRNLSGRFLIRVPLFDRDWLTPYKKEIGVEWRLDKTHYIEYTKISFYKEMQEAGLFIKEQEVMWGEIYAIVETGK